MLRPYALRALAILVCLPLSGTAATAVPPAGEVAVVSAEFGVFEDDGGDQLGFGATSVIPLSPGQSYGWLIELRTTKKSVAVREELAAARDAAEADADDGAAKDARGLDPTLQATSGPLLALVERRLPVMDGMLFAQHKVGAGDKPGRFRLRVYIEKQLAAVFSYEIAAAAADARPATPQLPAKPAKVPKNRVSRDPAARKP